MPDHVNTRRPSHCGHNNAHRSRGVFFGDALFIYGRGKRLLALPTSWWDRFPRAKDDKKACRGKRFPTLIAGGEMSPSQMRRGHNHNHRLQPPKRQERGKSARIYGLPEGCLCSLPCLFVADVGIAQSGANALVAEQLLNFPQILSHVVKEDRRCGMAQPVGCDLPHPERSTCPPEPQVERAV
jgi:hypothetical protein